VSVPQELLTIGVGLDTTAVESGLASLGDATDGVAVGLEERLSGASSGLADLAKGSTTASRGMSGLASVVSMVDPKLGGVIRSVSTLARGLGVLRLGFGPLAVVLGAATAGFALYQREQERVAAEMEAAEARANNLSDALQRVADSARDIEDQIRLVNGEIDSFGMAAETQAETAQAASDAVVDAYDAQIEASQNLLNTLEFEASRTATNLKLKRGTKEAADAAAAALATEEANMARLTQARGEEISRAERQIETIELLADFHRESREAQEREAAAREASAEAQRRATAADRERIASLAELERLQDEVGRIEESAALATMTPLQRLNAEYDAKIERLQAIQELSGGAVSTETALVALRLEHEQQLREAFEERRAEIQAAEEEDLARAKERLEERRAAQQAFQTDVAASIGSISALTERAAKRRADVDEVAARRMLAMSKSLGLTTIAIDTAVGIQKALAQSAGAPLLAAARIAAVIAGGATQAAAVSSQSLHQGGQLAPDEQAVRTVVLRDERITPDGRVMSPEATRRMERGEAGGGARVVPVPQFQHFGVFFADMVESGGTPLHDLINRGRDVGRAGY
jgi:hypothetical protein